MEAEGELIHKQSRSARPLLFVWLEDGSTQHHKGTGTERHKALSTVKL